VRGRAKCAKAKEHKAEDQLSTGFQIIQIREPILLWIPLYRPKRQERRRKGAPPCGTIRRESRATRMIGKPEAEPVAGLRLLNGRRLAFRCDLGIEPGQSEPAPGKRGSAGPQRECGRDRKQPAIAPGGPGGFLVMGRTPEKSWGRRGGARLPSRRLRGRAFLRPGPGCEVNLTDELRERFRPRPARQCRHRNECASHAPLWLSGRVRN